ncbi:hypothetical protein OG21DRAFT_1528165 [Imleria badia]|nr:hypothetical protein OG21DRAFT_1528165 [Imleria badia]
MSERAKASLEDTSGKRKHSETRPTRETQTAPATKKSRVEKNGGSQTAVDATDVGRVELDGTEVDEPGNEETRNNTKARSPSIEVIEDVKESPEEELRSLMVGVSMNLNAAHADVIPGFVVSTIIKKEESPLVVPLLFEETGDAKKEDLSTIPPLQFALPCPSRSLSMGNRSLSSLVAHPPLAPPPPTMAPQQLSNLLVVFSIELFYHLRFQTLYAKEYNWVYYNGNRRDVVRRSSREYSRHERESKHVYVLERDLRLPILILALTAAGLVVHLLPLFYVIIYLVFDPTPLSGFLRITARFTYERNRLIWGPRLRRTNQFFYQRPSNPAPSDADSEGDPLPDLEDVE